MRGTNAIHHFTTISVHKWLVAKLCFRCGLYRQGLCHDLSKYRWIEFSTGIKYFRGYRSPNSVERDRYGYSAAWLHHKGRNRHHWEYWTELIHGECVAIRMPIPYLIEMWCDRIAATRVYEKDAYTQESALNYFLRNYDNVIIHPDTKDLLEYMLRYTAKHGEKATVIWIRQTLRSKGYDLLDEIRRKRNETM